MHTTAMKIGKIFFDTYTAGMSNARVLDLGAQNINGSLRQVCPTHFEYIGADFVPGVGVDVLLKDPYILPFENESIDVATCSSVLEHAEFFWLLFLEIMRVLKPNGLLYINAPSNGPFHRYPVDCWRFYPDSGNALARWGNRNGVDCILLESFISNQDSDYWNDFVAIYLKDSSNSMIYPRRVIDTKKDFMNALVAGEKEIKNQIELPEDLQKLKLINKITQRNMGTPAFLSEYHRITTGEDN